MAATAEQIARLRRMISESANTTYTDIGLSRYIERYPMIDERGQEPYSYDTTTTPPTAEDNDTWIATYDLNAAAADLWAEKAAALADEFDFSADGGQFSRSQQYEQFMRQSRFYLARRSRKTIRLVKRPSETDASESWIGNI